MEGAAMTDDHSRLVRLEQQLEDLDKTVMNLTPMVTQVTKLSVHVENIGEKLGQLRQDVADVRRDLVEREADVSRERRATRVAAWALVGAILTAMIGATATIIAAGVTP